jgi:hypothetical protein
MFINYYFVLGLVNNVFLSLIFLLVATHNISVVERYGWIYLLLLIPTICAFFLKKPKKDAKRYTVFLGIFIAFLIIEAMYDHVFKISFRENWLLLVPYIILYWGMNYGFAVMVWKTSHRRGIIMIGLFVIQIIVNIFSHLV